MARVLVIGDAILDTHSFYTFKKMCPDRKDVKAVQLSHSKNFAGGAANVATNLAMLADDTTVIDFIGVISDDLKDAIRRSSNGRVGLDYSLISPQALQKNRISVDGELVLRVDNSSSIPDDLGKALANKLGEYLKNERPDLILLSDYAGGVLNKDLLDQLLKYAEILMVDTKESDLSKFFQDGKKCLLVKLNDAEWKAAQFVHHSPEWFFSFVVITHGAAGASIRFERKRSSSPSEKLSETSTVKIPGWKANEVDVCGCGDTFFAGLAVQTIEGRSILDSIGPANAAASIAVERFGTAVVTRDDLIERMKGIE